MLDLSIQIVWEEFESDGGLCSNCDLPIFGKMYVMMVQVGGPMEAKPIRNWCEECKGKWDKVFESKTE